MSHLPNSIIKSFFEQYPDADARAYPYIFDAYVRNILKDMFFTKNWKPLVRSPEQIMKDTLAEITNPFKTVIILKGEKNAC